MRYSSTLRLFAAVAALSIALPAAAAPAPMNGDKDVARLVVRGDVYIAGGLVDLAERVDGDLIAAGGTVNIEGGVAGDLLVTGGQIEVKGSVKDDLRVAGGKVRIRGTVGGDLVVFGGEITVDSTSTITGDVVLMGGTVHMEGITGGNLRIDADAIVVSGDVKGNAVFHGGNVNLRSRVLGNTTLIADAFSATPQARIEGKMEYWLSGGQQNFGAVVGGGAVYRPELQPSYLELDKPAAAAVGFGLLGMGLWSILSGMLFILLLMLIFRTHFQAAGKLLHKKPWSSLWNGFLAIVLTPILALVLCFTIIGIPLGIFLFVMYAFLFVFLKPIAALVLARFLESYWGRKWGFWSAFGWTVLVYIVLKLLMLVPIAGWAIVVILCLAGLGADNITKWGRFKKIR